MPSISHRASLGPCAPHRAKSGPAALPAGFEKFAYDNAVQDMTTSYGSNFLRPSLISGPRIARIGLRYEF